MGDRLDSIKVDMVKRQKGAVPFWHGDIAWLVTEVDALREVESAARDWKDDTEEECGHHPEWQAIAEALSRLDAHREKPTGEPT